MSDIIHLLPDHIANQIAAGEVIQRPASVVKELMENSVDAGARNINVNIKDAGRTLIQVIDDGKGMSETDARMAFERHATSKIASVDDLYALRTMGFRGEALASIAAVAQIELRTRTKGSETGICLQISGSALDSTSQISCPEGSIFFVKNLFYNVPARRKFLKANETEFRHILTEFERVVLVNQNISFSLRHNDALIYELPASGLKQRILDVFGKGMNQKLLSADTETSIVKIHGFVGNLNSVKKRGAQQYFFVNGRFMRHPYFHKAVMQAYEQMIPAGEAPDYFIYFELNPSSIDVNIHPTKTEIKFENEKPIWQILYSAVREALAKSNSMPSIDFETENRIDIPIYNPHSTNVIKHPEIETDKSYNPFREHTSKRPIDDWQALYAGFEKEREFAVTPSVSSTQESNPDIESALFTDISNVCFQYKNRYIITSLKSGLAIIDQHRAHVRTLYNKYMANIIKERAASQRLIFPEIVELTASEASLLALMKDEIRYLGFEIDSMGGASYAINGVPPDATAGVNPAVLIKDILSLALEDVSVSRLDNRAEKLALSLARATAIRAGKTLTQEEMEMLVAQLFATEDNGITPDGLPVLTVLTDDELSKRV